MDVFPYRQMLIRNVFLPFQLLQGVKASHNLVWAAGLPRFAAKGSRGGGSEEVGQGLSLTGFFLERFVFAPQDRPLPPPRRRLAERFTPARAAEPLESR